MVLFKRFLHIILIIAVLGGIFLIYNINDNRPASVQALSGPSLDPEFIGTAQVNEGERPRVWLLGDPGDEHCGEIYSNVRQLCEDLQLAVAGQERLNADEVKDQELVIFCDDSVSRYADLAELEAFIAGGGRVILAAGIGEGDARLWPVAGIRERSPGEDYHDLVFEKPLLPVQPEQAWYDGNSGSARIEVSAGASVYIRSGGDGVPLLYTYDWQKGGVCLINGTFLADVRCMGLLTGAMAALLPDFVYPVLGVKAVFLDGFPMITPAGDELCRRVYGYSAEGFVRDVLWPAFQGMSLRTDTPYTSSILAAASSEESFQTADDAVFTAICKPALQFGGELVYAVSCPEEGQLVFNQDFIDRFTAAFTSYTVQGLVMETGNFSPEMLDVPGADIRSVRGMLDSRDARLSWEDGYTVFPAATRGNSMEGGSLFAICSVLAAYGMVSHVFDVDLLITRDGSTAAWDLDRLQVSLFEAEVLSRVSWLEGRTLSQTAGDVRSYQDMDYGWKRSGSCIELDCSGAVKGQAFFYHTDSRITGGSGLTYQDVGNGYYLLRMQENHGTITLEEEG